MKRILMSLLAAAACLTVLALSATAQDFSKSYALTAGGTVRIANVSGDVKVTGTDGTSVEVKAFKTGRDKDKVEVEDLSAGNGVELKVRYPECDGKEGRHSCSYEADVRFEVSVPRSINLSLDKISTASGDIEVSGVEANIRVSTASGNVIVANSHGDIRASTASGNVTVRNVAGQVNASSASGDVEADIARLEGNDNMSFNTASGNVNVRMPADLDADVSMSTVSGKVKTDFPIEVKESEYGGGTHAKGRIGSGMRQVRLSSASGDVSLTRM
jgi:DUF4097 and DUF4098 domain-containing protein YvlB